MGFTTAQEFLRWVRVAKVDPSRIQVDGKRGHEALALLAQERGERGYGAADRAVANPFTRVRRGRRDDLGGMFFRSQWEANWARYLNYLGVRWEYETKTFEFPIRHGITRYTPDFWLPDEERYVEIKGYMDAKSKTKLKRMQIYYPEVRIEVVTKLEYMDVARAIGPAIPGWEE